MTKAYCYFLPLLSVKTSFALKYVAVKKKTPTTHPFNSILITIYFHHCVCPCVYVKWAAAVRTGSSGEFVLCCLFPGCVRTSLSRRIKAQDSPHGFPPSLRDSASVTVSISPALLTCSCYLHLFMKPGLKYFLKNKSFRFYQAISNYKLCVLLQHLRSRQIVCRCWPCCVTVCVRRGARMCFPRRCRVQMRWWARRQSGPSLFFFTTWETRTTTSSALLCCTHMYMYKHR